jgi:hypothetical protein
MKWGHATDCGLAKQIEASWEHGAMKGDDWAALLVQGKAPD